MEKIIILIMFFIVMVSIGVYCRRKATNVSDFVLGGRNVGPWLTAFAYGTTYFSAVIFIGYAGKFGWSFGVAATWIGIGNALIGSLLAWVVLGKRTRRMTNFLDAQTMPEFFEKRYNSKALKIISALIIFIFLVPYSASVYTGLGYLFEMALGIPYIYCMIGMAVLTGLYLILGGYMATAINDFVQGIIMLAGIILVVLVVLSRPEVGGLIGGINNLTKIGPQFSNVFGGNPRDLIGLIILTSLGTWGLPQMVHKFYAIKDDKAIRTGTVISTVFALVIAGGSYFVGSFAKLILNNKVPIDALTGKPNYDLVMPNMLNIALPDTNTLMSILMGVVIVLVLSASMSTLSSLVLVSSSSLTLDFIKGIMFPKMQKDKQLLYIRIFCGIFVAASVIVALQKGTIVTLMSFSWGAIAGSFLAPFVYGLFWKGVTKAGVWAGFITGVGITLTGLILFLSPAFKLAPQFYRDLIIPPNVGAAAMLISLIVVPVVSIISKKMDKSYVNNVFTCLEDTKEGIKV